MRDVQFHILQLIAGDYSKYDSISRGYVEIPSFPPPRHEFILHKSQLLNVQQCDFIRDVFVICLCEHCIDVYFDNDRDTSFKKLKKVKTFYFESFCIVQFSLNWISCVKRPLPYYLIFNQQPHHTCKHNQTVFHSLYRHGHVSSDMSRWIANMEHPSSRKQQYFPTKCFVSVELWMLKKIEHFQNQSVQDVDLFLPRCESLTKSPNLFSFELSIPETNSVKNTYHAWTCPKRLLPKIRSFKYFLSHQCVIKIPASWIALQLEYYQNIKTPNSDLCWIPLPWICHNDTHVDCEWINEQDDDQPNPVQCVHYWTNELYSNQFSHHRPVYSVDFASFDIGSMPDNSLPINLKKITESKFANGFWIKTDHEIQSITLNIHDLTKTYSGFECQYIHALDDPNPSYPIPGLYRIMFQPQQTQVMPYPIDYHNTSYESLVCQNNSYLITKGENNLLSLAAYYLKKIGHAFFTINWVTPPKGNETYHVVVYIEGWKMLY